MKILFLPMGMELNTDKEITLLEAAFSLGITLGEDLCGIQGCGRCKVKILDGNTSVLSEEEVYLLTETEKSEGVRLACCFRVKSDVTVLVLAQNFQNRIWNGIQEKEAKRLIKNHEIKIKQVEVYFVFDIGTTTLEGAMADAKSGEILFRIATENPQREIGMDVISRITYCLKNKNGEEKLHTILIKKINQLLEEMENGYISLRGENHQIIHKCYAFAGNTTMIHLLRNKSVASLGTKPFESEYKGGEILESRLLGLTKNNVKTIIPGIIGGHVGADAYTCVIDTDLSNKKEMSLVVDVGTNGEIILNNHGKLTACSAAAGPAFEGMNITNGMKNKKGAIKGVKLVSSKGKEGKIELEYVVEGHDNISSDSYKTTFIRGICGSGLIDLIGTLLEKRIIDDTGKIQTENMEFEINNKVKLYQRDVRNLQLAKAGIITAIYAILEINKISVDELDKIYVAGEFGSHISVKNAVGIGLFPDISEDKFFFMGNSVINGLIKYLMEEKYPLVPKDIAHVELAEYEGFSKLYVNNMNF